jgi:DNA-binding IclR family transcriptional regulator
VKSATRVLDLFELLGRWNAARTHAEIADELAIPKSSLTKLLQTLVQREYLKYSPRSKGYELGSAIAGLAGRISDGIDLVEISESVLSWVTAETQESCALNVRKGDRSEVVASVMSPRRFVYHMRLGDTAPLHATSGGKALLAHLPAEALKTYLKRTRFEKLTAKTIDNAAALERALRNIRATGFATVIEEFTPGIAGIARPILGASGLPLAAINVAIPTARFDRDLRELCMRTLTTAAATIHHRLQALESSADPRRIVAST